MDFEDLRYDSLKIKELLNIFPGDVYWKDKNGVWKGLNQHCLQSLLNMGLIKHAKSDEVIGKSDYDIFNKESADLYRKHDLEVMEKKTEITLEETVKLNNGSEVAILSIKRPLFNAKNQVIGILGNTTDITHLKRMEEELRATKSAMEASKAKATAEEEMRKTVMVLVGDIVHDLRTPIATIRTVTSILEPILPILLEGFEAAEPQKQAFINPKKRDYLKSKEPILSLQGAVTMMDEFINTTLIELRSAQKAWECELTDKDLTLCSSRRIIENTLEAYPFPQGIKIDQKITYDFFLKGNSILIMKILFNLIKNAMEQIALKGKGEITLTTEDAGDKNLIKIKDTAGGAPPEVVAQFFKEYFSTKRGGTGIGLSYCKKTMGYFGGDITCHSVYGDSMEFVLSFPKET